MRTELLALLLSTLLCCLPLTHVAVAQSTASPGAPTEAVTTQPGRLVFRLLPDFRAQASATAINVSALTAALQRIGATQLHQKFANTLPPDGEKPESVDLSLIYEVSLPATTDLNRAQQLLVATGTVAYAEPLRYYAPLYQPNDPLADSTGTSGQYHLRNIRAYGAWDITKGDTTVVIGIADTGTRFTHEDLAQVKYNYSDPIDGIDNDNDGYIDNFRGWDLADNDNDPNSDPLIGQKVHGILVTGVASSTPDNGLGVAGVGFHCKYMPLKIWPSTQNGLFAGFEAVVYAADHGCKVLNLSWGGASAPSQFEQEVINYAVINRDMVIVAAAGNTNAELDFYPASYDNVISVTGIQANNIKAGAQTYSRRIDVSAPGTGIFTTLGDASNDYISTGGSSFASPIVAGTVALVRSRFPNYSAAQVIAQLRATANPDIYTLPGNAAFVGKLGTGRVDAHRAVATTNAQAVRVVTSQFMPNPVSGQAMLAVDVQNMLSPITNLQITLISESPYLTVTMPRFAVPALPTLGRATNVDIPYLLTIASNTPLNTTARIRYEFTADNGYRDTQYATIRLNLGYVVLNANDLHLTLTSQGTIGYDTPGSGIGESVTYRQSSPLLFEGGLIVATSPTKVSDRVRGIGTSEQDFYVVSRLKSTHTMLSDYQEYEGIFQDSLPSRTRPHTVGVRVKQRADAWSTQQNHDYVVLRYQITNVTADTLKPLYAGLFMDWDLPNPIRNVADWDASRSLGYVYSPANPTLYMGIQVLAGGEAAYYAINNAATTGPVAIGAIGGLSKAAKFAGLSNGTTYATAGLPNGGDVSQIIGAALRNLAPGDSTTLTLAILGAPSLAALQATADAARARYAQILPTRSPTSLTASWQVYPNPTTGILHLQAPVGFAPVEVSVLNQLGAVILRQSVSGSSINLDLRDHAAGLYMVQLRNAAGTLTTRRVVVQR